MDINEYLEKAISDAFKREFDQEENVVRSLPFFAAVLALLISTVGVVRDAIPHLSTSWFSVFSWLMIGGIGISIALVLFYLWHAVRRRRFDYPMREADLVQYANGLRNFHTESGVSPEQLDGVVIADIRQTMIDQLARAAMQNRENNASRSIARGRALTTLVTGLGLAFLLVAGIIVRANWTEEGARNAHTATASSDAGSHEGRVEVGRNTTNDNTALGFSHDEQQQLWLDWQWFRRTGRSCYDFYDSCRPCKACCSADAVGRER